MKVHLFGRRLAPALLVTILAGLGTLRSGAQDQLAASADLEKGHSAHYQALSKMMMGQQTPTAADKNALDAEAKFLIYRFTVAPTPIKPNDLVKAQKDFVYFVDRVEEVNARKINRAFVKQMSPVLVKRFKDVFDQDFMVYRRAILNLGPMLPQAARFKDEAIGSYLVEILTDHEAGKGSKLKNKHDAIKLYAARGLREFFPVAIVADPNDVTAAAAKAMARETGYVDALVRFIDRPTSPKLSAPEQAAIRFLRREAIESLAHSQAPAIIADKKKIEAPIAPTLLRILSPKSGLDPAPSLHERLEAAIGVCQMQYAKLPEYQPEIGIYLVGVFLQDYATAYNKDLVGVLDATKRRPAELHWRNHYKRLEMALGALAKNAKNHPSAEKMASQLSVDGLALIAPMKGPQLNPINQGQVVAFRKMVANIRPKSNTPFKNAQTIVIELDAAKEAE